MLRSAVLLCAMLCCARLCHAELCCAVCVSNTAFYSTLQNVKKLMLSACVQVV